MCQCAPACVLHIQVFKCVRNLFAVMSQTSLEANLLDKEVKFSVSCDCKV
jgi:hypothetical protein